MSVTVIVFAKAPVPGLAKTRLAPALGADGAAELAARMLEHTVGQAAAAGLGPVEVCAAPDARHPLFELLAREHGVRLSEQGSGDLGERMHRAFERWLAPAQSALLIGAGTSGWLIPAGRRRGFQGRPYAGWCWHLIIGPVRRRSNCSRHGELSMRP